MIRVWRKEGDDEGWKGEEGRGGGKRRERGEGTLVMSSVHSYKQNREGRRISGLFIGGNNRNNNNVGSNVDVSSST